jgi:hypothetical protein
MENSQVDIVRLLKKISEKPAVMDVVYVNRRLLDDLFDAQFGGIGKLVQSIERTAEKSLKSELGAGLGGIIAQLFLNLKASIKAEGKIGTRTKTVIEEELTLQKKIGLCEASLADQDAIVENPGSSRGLAGKYLKLVDVLPTITWENRNSLTAGIGPDAAKRVIARWRDDQKSTPASRQVALVAGRPFCMAAIVRVQPDVDGSTYITHAPPPPKHRSVLAEAFPEEGGVTFLKTYWIVDARSR